MSNDTETTVSPKSSTDYQNYFISRS